MLYRQSLRPFAALLLLPALLVACAAPQRIYSLDPVDNRGDALPLARVVALRLETGQSVAIDGALQLREDRLEHADGRHWLIAAVHSLDYLDEQGHPRRARIDSPQDLLDFEELPRIAQIRLLDGRSIDLGDDNPWSRWTDDRLGIEVSQDGYYFDSYRLSEVHTVTLYNSSLMDGTVKSWRFWVVGAAATTLIWVISTRSEENQAVR